jgi:Uma2 family endonuclease
MATAAPRTMTIEEFSEFEGDSPCDLIDGELVEMAAGGLHGMIALTIGSALLSFVRPRHLGAVMVSETTFILSVPRQNAVRPDVAYLRSERVPPMPEFSNEIPYAPDLAVEVVSPSDRASAVNAKVEAYMDANTRLVWVVDPIKRTVTAFSPNKPTRFYRDGQTLDGGEVLPGFALPLAELFEL